MRKNGRHLAVVAVLVVIGAVITYFLLTAIYQLPEAASAEAGPIDELFTGHFLFISFFFSLIVVFVLYSIVVFRRKPEDEEPAAQFHGNTPLEIIWTIIPLAIVIGFGIWGWIVLSEVTAEAPDELVVRVTGRQWQWTFDYPDYGDVGTTTELVLPVDRPVLLEMVSEDVLHSFWVPEFRVKQDLLPETVTTLRITPTIEGDYKVRCAEICGFDHSGMLAGVSVRSQPEFDAWLSEQAGAVANLSPEERGANWSAQFACAGCHSADGSAMAGPTWLNIYGSEEMLSDGSTVTVDDPYLLKSILEPSAQIVAGYENVPMPANFEELFAAEQARLLESAGVEIDIAADLIAYIHSLSDQQ
ncbi:MAG: cytochrome c oxidase subunit II [Chloroflexota bacterium]|nr:MAG: cytochrome c oxidase subunit II [Chloroflexota bacterium]